MPRPRIAIGVAGLASALLALPAAALASSGGPASSAGPASAAAPPGSAATVASSGGALLAWGANRSGSLGDGTTADSNVPVAVTLPAGMTVKSASAGSYHSLALTSGGQVLAWGSNTRGELGDGSTAGRALPGKVRLPSGVKARAALAGCHDSMALTTTGRVLTWGNNDFGELGNGTRTSSSVPVWVKLPAGTKVTAIRAGCFFDLALTSTGRLLAWGRDYLGSLGDGRLNASSTVPVTVRLPAGVRVVSFAAGNYDAVAVSATGQVYRWGQGPDIPTRVKLPASSQIGTVAAVAAGALHFLALTSRGGIVAWGYNYAGQLGNGSTCNCTLGPVRVKLPAGVKVTAIRAGFYNSYALTTTGAVLAWGDNTRGELGAGSSLTASGTPLTVALPAGFAATTIGGGPVATHSFAIGTPTVPARTVTASQRASTVTASPAAGAGAVPTGFQPLSASFLSAARGFVLGTVNCPPGHSCKQWLVATADGGAHWRVLPTPPPDTSARNVVFAGRRIGWAYSPGLWVTRDGGTHWRRLTIHGLVDTVQVAAGIAYAIVSPAGESGTELFASPVGRSAWKHVGALTSAPVSSLAVLGHSVWFGAGSSIWTTADGRHWHNLPFACTGSHYGLTSIAAATASRVDFLCTNTANFDTASEGMEVMASADGGKTEHLAGRKAPVIGDGGVITLPPGRPAVITFATSVGIPSWLGRSSDGGKTWRRVALYRSGGWNSLSYVNGTEGWIVNTTVQLLRTTDSGRTWHKVAIGG